MSEHIARRHNKSLLLYHLVCPAKHRKAIFSPSVERTLRDVCLGIGQRYEIHFVEIGSDDDHVHFLIQSVPTLSPSVVAQKVKSVTAREILAKHPEIKEVLWGGKFWTSGFYINTVGQYANEQVIRNYVQNQRKNYRPIYRNQLTLFEDLI